jgi:hypothetical protein
MTDYLNWTIDAVPRAWSEYDEDHMDLINGTYDMYTLTFEKTKVREQFFDFSEHLYEVRFLYGLFNSSGLFVIKFDIIK